MNSELSREDILLAFSVEPHHDKQTLDIYIEKYPYYKAELIELSIDLLIHEELDETTSNTTSTAVHNAWSYFQSLTESKKNEISLKTENPFGKVEAKQFRELSKKLDITTLFLSRIRDRGIKISTIPLKFIKQLTEALKVDATLLNSYLSKPHTINASENFKSNNKPEVNEKISFQEAIETSQLTDSQKDKLKILLD